MSLSLLDITSIWPPFVVDEPVVDVGVTPLRLAAIQTRAAGFDAEMLRIAGYAATEMRQADFIAIQGD